MFPVHKVAPAANGLADEQPQSANVQYGRGFDLLHLGIDKQADHCTDDTAIDGETALPYVEDPDGSSL